jgi:eukaryotic-like serine/threonine-protein kinase
VSDERLTDVFRVCEQALSESGAARAAYLDSACVGNPELRREVEALIAEHESGKPSPLDEPVWERPGPALGMGQRLGPYEITGTLGTGGMGEVYRARDTRLGRSVAIKVLPPEMVADAARRLRFEREARAIAALSHPHICPIYDVGREGPIDFLVMEHLEGHTLAERLRTGPLAVEQALTISVQIGQGLAAAHRKGIVHCDLKPANVMLTETGAKLLDFGLASVGGRAPIQTAPEFLSAVTQSGAFASSATIVGTAPYMSPEQARGERLDARTDVFSFGCVLYEMLAGDRPFGGATAPDVIASVLQDEPPRLPADRVSSSLDLVVRRCLAKDRAQRFQSASDLLSALQPMSGERMSSVKPGRSRTARWVVTASIACGLVATVVLYLAWPQGSTELRYLPLSVASEGLTLGAGGAAVSPDGQSLVFSAQREGSQPCLYLKGLGAPSVRRLERTEGGSVPFFEPRGKWVGFVTSSQLAKVNVDTGKVVPLCKADYQGVSRASWGANGRIYFTAGTAIYRVSESGGTPELIRDAGEGRYLWPQVLPGGRAILFTKTVPGKVEAACLRLADDKAVGEPMTLVGGAAAARYAAPGLLLYELNGNLMASRFDPDTLQLRGEPVLVFRNVAVGNSFGTVFSDFDVSASGSLVAWPAASILTRLVIRDRGGTRVSLRVPADRLAWPSMYPDGERISVTQMNWLPSIWSGRLDGIALRRVVFSDEEAATCSVLDRKGRNMYFGLGSQRAINVFRAAADGTTQERLTADAARQKPTSVSPDGSRLLFNHLATSGADRRWKRDVFELEIASRRERPVIRTTADELEAAYSPDGRWVAYQSNELGSWDIYVSPYPVTGRGVRVSTDGGFGPAWSRDGMELFYTTRTSFMAVNTSGGVPNGPHRLFPLQTLDDYRRQFDVLPDGRFVFLEPADSRSELIFVEHWLQNVRSRVR